MIKIKLCPGQQSTPDETIFLSTTCNREITRYLYLKRRLCQGQNTLWKGLPSDIWPISERIDAEACDFERVTVGEVEDVGESKVL